MLASTVDVHLDLTEPSEQSIKVTVRWTPSTRRLVLQFPLWTPGSYTVRDPVQHLHSLRLVSAAGPIAYRRLAPNRWLVDLNDLAALELTYVIEARDLTVRTAHLDPDFAAISLAAVVMELEGLMPYWMDVAASGGGQRVVRNDITLDAMVVLTGPNTAGKGVA